MPAFKYSRAKGKRRSVDEGTYFQKVGFQNPDSVGALGSAVDNNPGAHILISHSKHLDRTPGILRGRFRTTLLGVAASH